MNTLATKPNASSTSSFATPTPATARSFSSRVADESGPWNPISMRSRGPILTEPTTLGLI